MQHEGCGSGAGLVGVFDCKSNHLHMLIPIGLVEAHNSSQNFFQASIHVLCLAIRLRVESSGHPPFCPQEFCCGFPELRSKPDVSVRQKDSGHPCLDITLSIVKESNCSAVCASLQAWTATYLVSLSTHTMRVSFPSGVSLCFIEFIAAVGDGSLLL